MKYKKLKAFTMAELMILLLTLSILLAAFSPVMTKREHKVVSDDVWTFVPGDDNNDAYFDATNKAYTSQAFVGISAKKTMDVGLASQDADTHTLYSKLVIRAGNSVAGGKTQNQMQFRVGNDKKGTLVGSLFAGDGNFLVGGPYSNNITGINNTAYGVSALELLSSGYKNTAVGYGALADLSSGDGNVAVGYKAGSNVSRGIGNTYLGTKVGATASDYARYNTILGAFTSSSGEANTSVGYKTLQSLESGRGNTAVGESAMRNFQSGNYNTALGSSALDSPSSPIKESNNNTAIGSGSGYIVSEFGSNKTFITTYNLNISGINNHNVFSDDVERIFIGHRPADTISKDTLSLLEIHNINKYDKNNKMLPIPGIGYSSVVINGNLIVRGQSYFETPIIRPATYTNERLQHPENYPKGLVAYRLVKYSGNKAAFMGFDGADRDGRSYEGCRGCRQHGYNDLRKNCICTTVGSYCGNTNYKEIPYSTSSLYPTKSPSTSYDWTTHTTGDFGCSEANGIGMSYRDAGEGCKVTLERSSTSGNYGERGTDMPLAHMLEGSDGLSSLGYTSCCPDLRSDARLKNIGDKFTAGLDQLKRLNIYNYTFKNDPNKIPQVGVIAQDLKQIFPNAVKKGDDGYYKIRWDEMLYTLINSIKEVNTKVEKLASNILSAKNRLADLKKDNAELNARLDALEAEISVLESKKH